MMHDFSLTEHHVVLYDLPVTFDVGAATASVPRAMRPGARFFTNRFVGRRPVPEAGGAPDQRPGRQSTTSLPYSWDPGYPARVGVFRRDGDASDVRWFDVEPCYVFHPLNAYDDGDHDRPRRRAPPEDVRHRPPRPQRGTTDARSLDGRPRERARCSRSASTTTARSSPASTSGWWAAATATATASGSPTAARPATCSATTWWPAPRRCATSVRATASVRWSSSPTVPTPPEDRRRPARLRLRRCDRPQRPDDPRRPDPRHRRHGPPPRPRSRRLPRQLGGDDSHGDLTRPTTRCLVTEVDPLCRRNYGFRHAFGNRSGAGPAGPQAGPSSGRPVGPGHGDRGRPGRGRPTR